MSPSDIGMVAALFLLVIASAFFSATETAFSSLSKVRLKVKADAGDKKAARVLTLEDDYDRLISTTLVGNNIVNIAAATVSTVLFVQGLRLRNGAVLSTVVMTVLILIFGEVCPKTMAKETAESYAMKVAPTLSFFMIILRPITLLLSLFQKWMKHFVHGGEESITEEELAAMVDQAESEGGLDEHEGELIRSAIEFGDIEVQEILTPRVDIIAVEDTDSMDNVAQIFSESGYSRLPVYHEDVDDIVGVIHEKDFYAARYAGEQNIKNLVSDILYTTGNTKIIDLMRMLQEKKEHIVIVVDEFGGTEGLCTLEDIVEELVGEIWDEHDEVIEDFAEQEDGSYFVDGSAALSDLFDLFEINDETEISTVSGWVVDQIGHVPAEGDNFKADGLDVTVTKVEHRRVLQVKVIPLPIDESAEDSDDN